MTVTHSLVPRFCQGPTHRRTGDASDLTAGTEQSRQREVEVGRGDGNSSPGAVLEGWRPWAGGAVPGPRVLPSTLEVQHRPLLSE